VFQTPDYARAVITATGPWLGSEEISRRVAARAARQQALFNASEVPHMHVVLDESALRRQVGSEDVMRQQISALAGVVQRPEVVIQIMSFAAGACASIAGDFVILDFPDPEDPLVVYTDGLFGDLYLESRGENDRCILAWTQMSEQALDPAASAAMIADLAKDPR
jgi:hypothetical protein